MTKQEESYRKPDGEEVDPEYMRDWSGWQSTKQGEIRECDGCRFLLHYEWNEIEKKHNSPRCSIEFRDGSQIKHPCLDYQRRVQNGN